MTDPYDIFKQFWPDKMFKTIVDNTNAYYDHELAASKVRKTYMRAWRPVTMRDIHIFIGICIKMQIDKKPKIAWYWKTPNGPAAPTCRLANFMSLKVRSFSYYFLYKIVDFPDFSLKAYNFVAFPNHLEIFHHLRSVEVE
jgi:hypothetical protein